MTRDEIIRMAREVGIKYRGFGDEFYSPYSDGVEIEQMQAFAQLVAAHTLANVDPSKFMSYQEGYEAGAAAEREACAKVCDDRVSAYKYATDPWAQEHINEARHLGAAIRARGQQ